MSEIMFDLNRALYVTDVEPIPRLTHSEAVRRKVAEVRLQAALDVALYQTEALKVRMDADLQRRGRELDRVLSRIKGDQR